MIDILEGVIVRPLIVETRVVPTYYLGFNDGLPWYHDIYQFLRYNTYPEAVTTKKKRALRQLATHFVICGE